MRPEPVAAALDALRRPDSTVILLDPVGEVFRQARAADLAEHATPHLRVPALRGRRRADPRARRPRAVDRRLRADRRRAAGARRHRRGHSGCCRAPSTPRRPTEESFSAGLLEYPQYTRPPTFRGMDVPAILASGDHGAVAALAGRAGAGPGPASAGRTCSSELTGADRAPDRRRPSPCYTPPPVAPRDHSEPSRPAASAAHRPRNRRVNVLDEIVQDQLRTDLPELASGDTVKVSAKVVEGNRERIQVFEGTVMRLRGGGITRSITVRRIASRRRRRADVQDPQPAHREDRGRPPRPGPPRPALLPAQPRRQGRDPPRAPHEQLVRAAARHRPSTPPSRRGRFMSGAATLVADDRHRPDASATSAASGTKDSSESSASTRSASRRRAARSSRRP